MYSLARPAEQRGHNYPPLAYGTTEAQNAYQKQIEHIVACVNEEPVTAAVIAARVRKTYGTTINLARVARMLTSAEQHGHVAVTMEAARCGRQRKLYFTPPPADQEAQS